MSDKPKNKKWDVVAQVPVRRVPKRSMQLRQDVASGSLEGRRFEVAMGMDGGLWVDFERAPGEPEGELSADRFVLRIDDLMEGISRVVVGDPEAEVDSTVRGGLTAERTDGPPEPDVPFEGAYGTRKGRRT